MERVLAYCCVGVLIAVLWLAVWMDFALRASQAHTGKGSLVKKLRLEYGLSTADRGSRFGKTTTAWLNRVHRTLVEQILAESQGSLTLGGLALAAWAVVATFQRSPPEAEPPAIASALLLLGATFTILGAFLFHSGTQYGTLMALYTVRSIGYALMVLALASAVRATFPDRTGVVLEVAMVLLVIAGTYSRAVDGVRSNEGAIGPRSNVGSSSAIKHWLLLLACSLISATWLLLIQ